MKEIKLSLGMFALVDDEDYDLLIKWKWYIKPSGRTFYARHSTYINGKNGTISMHRFILGLNDPNIFTDHIDHNGLNNQRHNLRISDYRTNNFNALLHKDSFTGYKGVTFYKRTGLWQARINVNGKQHCLKYHKTKELAALAYNEAAVRLHGEFATINQVQP